MRNHRRYSAFVRCTILAWIAIQLGPSAIAGESVRVTVDPNKVIRTNNRHLMGHNLSFVDKAFGTWDSNKEAFEDSFWQPYTEAAPGMVRFPGGNWGYGYHFNLARQGIAHRINFSNTPAQHFRPQHFLQLIEDLNNREGIESTPLIHLSAQFTSPEEAGAWVAYMIAPKDENCRTIGTDSWERKDKSGTLINWQDTCHWGERREEDGAPRYTGTLYVQFGNEEWIKACEGCSGMTDYYGVTRHQRAMTIQKEMGIPSQVTAYWPKYQALWAKLRGLNGLFTGDEVKVGALALAGIQEPRGEQDRFLDTQDHWNQVLLTNIADDAGSDVDFLALHTYMYTDAGWEMHSAFEQRHNLLASHDHLRARIEQIRNQVKPALTKPIYITEYNTHLRPADINEPRSIPASSLLDALHVVNWTSEVMYNKAIGGLVRWQTVAKVRTVRKIGGYPLFVAHDNNARSQIWKMSSFYAAKLLAALHPKVVGVKVSKHETFEPSGFSAESWTWWKGYDVNTKTGPAIPYLTAAATLSTDREELALLLLNRNTVNGYDVSLRVRDSTPRNSYTRISLNSVNLDEGHGDLFDKNGFGLGPGAVEEISLTETVVDRDPGVIEIGPHEAVVIKLNIGNLPPIAKAGPNQTVAEGARVLLDGSASSDPDGKISAYRWRQTSGPAVRLRNANSVRAIFRTPAVTEKTQWVFELTVTDDKGATSIDSTTITALGNANQPPVADAGTDQIVAEGVRVILNGRASRDPDGRITAHQWRQISGPDVTLNNAKSARAKFRAPAVTEETRLVFELRVTDDEGATSVDRTRVTVRDNANQPPVADAGTDQIVAEGVRVILDGRASRDRDGSITAYRWRQISGPDVTLNNANRAHANFPAPAVTEETRLVFELRVTDDAGAKSNDRTTVTVREDSSPRIPGMAAVVNGDASNPPVVDLTAGQSTAQISYGNREDYPVKAAVQKWSTQIRNWRHITVIDETSGETVANLSPGWVDIARQVFHYDGRWHSGRWAIPENSTRTFRIRLMRRINGSWVTAGDWLTFRIKR